MIIADVHIYIPIPVKKASMWDRAVGCKFLTLEKKELEFLGGS